MIKNKLFFVIILMMVSSGCSRMLKMVGLEKKGYAESKSEEYFTEMRRLQIIAKNNLEPKIQAQAHLDLAVLYARHNNPQRNYITAYEELKQYIEINPKGEISDSAQNLLAILQEIINREKENKVLQESNKTLNETNRNLTANNKNLTDNMEGNNKATNIKNKEFEESQKKLQNTLDKISQENKELISKFKDLTDENNKLKATFEELKSIDINLEKKRKSFKE